MSHRLTLRLSGDATRALWSHSALGTGRGSLDQAPLSQGDLVSVLVPAEDVLVMPVTLPGRSRARLLQALPYALEESLADDIDRYHFALGKPLATGRYLASITDRSNMDRWLSALESAGIETRSMLPDSLALPTPNDENHAVVVLEGDRALVRVGAAQAFAVSRPELDGFLMLEAGLTAITCCDLTAQWQSELPIDVQYLSRPANLFELFGGQLDSPVVNLLQGRYQTANEKNQEAASVWKKALIAGVAAAILALTGRVIEHQRLAGSVDELSAQATSLLQETFPDISRVVPGQERVQLEQRLNQMRSLRGDIGGEGFLYLLRVAGPALVSAGGVSLESVSFRSGSLLMELHAGDLASIENLRQTITASSGIPVGLESARTVADGADAMLRIGRDAG